MSESKRQVDNPSEQGELRREWGEGQKEAAGVIIGLLRKHPVGGFSGKEHAQSGPRVSDRMSKLLEQIARGYPAALNHLDIDGRTALCWLGRRRRPDLMRVFLDLGADPFRAGNDGVLPLFEAAAYSAGESLCLLARATGIEAQTCPPKAEGKPGAHPLGGATALISAAFHSNAEGLETLLAMGANPLARTKEGFTAMHVLGMGKKAIESAWPCVEILMRKNRGLLRMTNEAGLLPHDIALAHQSALGEPLRALWEALELGRSSEAGSPRRSKPL